MARTSLRLLRRSVVNVAEPVAVFQWEHSVPHGGWWWGGWNGTTGEERYALQVEDTGIPMGLPCHPAVCCQAVKEKPVVAV